jgi:hypothetical protein
MNTVIYFELDKGGDIYLGFSGNQAVRRRTHSYAGRKRLLAVRALQEDEDRLHNELAPYLVSPDEDGDGGNSTYRPDPEVLKYLEWLVVRQYGFLDREQAATAPLLAYSEWAFRCRNDGYEQFGGQLHFGTIKLPLRQRLRWAAAASIPTKNSLSDEWLTPKHIIELARSVMGGIDTDPATIYLANDWIQATRWYSREQNGLAGHNQWLGRVWLNPPYGKGDGSAGDFATRLEQEYLKGAVSEAITCLNADSMTSLWFDTVWRTATVHCVWRGRLNFIPGDPSKESSATKGTVFSYYGRDSTRFKMLFGPHGHLIVPLCQTVQGTMGE